MSSEEKLKTKKKRQENNARRKKKKKERKFQGEHIQIIRNTKKSIDSIKHMLSVILSFLLVVRYSFPFMIIVLCFHMFNDY